jgi:hypothetical protein
VKRVAALVAAVAAAWGLMGLPVASGVASARAEQPEPSSSDPAPLIFVLLVDGASFEQLLEVPSVAGLARSGGAALLSPVTPRGDRGGGAFLTLGAGVRSVGLEERVLGFDPGEPFEGRPATEAWRDLHGGVEPPRGPFLLRTDSYEQANEGRSVPGLLGEVLAANGRTVAVVGNADDAGGVSRPAILVGMDRAGVAPGGTLRASGTAAVEAASAVLSTADVVFLHAGADLTAAAAALEILGEGVGGREILVLVIAPSPSDAMHTAKDQVTGLVMGIGLPDDLFTPHGPGGTLTSATTRRVGVVSNEDVAPTILSFLGLAVPAEMAGSPIRFESGAAPFELHQRHLANRRMSVPVQVGAGIAVTILGLAGIALLAARRRIPFSVGRGSAIIGLVPAPLATSLLAAGDLPELSYGTVVSFVVAVTAAGAGAALLLRRLGPLVPPAAIGLGVLVYLVVEAATGWSATTTTFLGGTALDGARFYGLPNVDVGLLLGSAVYAAAPLAPLAGVSILCAVALFVGWPDLGADLGGALTLFAAAGLWLGLRARPGLGGGPAPRFGWRRVAGLAGVTAAVVLAGMALVAAAHAWLADTPTHGTRFAQAVGDEGIGEVVRVALRRLSIGWRLVVDVPFAAIPVLGLPVCLWAILRPWGPVGEAIARHPEWRLALIVITVGSIVALFANDTGPAAAGLGFGMAAAGILYLPLVEESWKPRRR